MTKPLHPKRLPETVILLGLTFWMTIAWFNNLTDAQTNIYHLETMLTMSLLHDTPLAEGLVWRAWPSGWGSTVLGIVIVVQAAVILSLWYATVTYIRSFFARPDLLTTARQRANYALTLFGGLWLSFLCGGLWFGYWIRQGAIQNVHMTLLLITLATLIFINLPEQPTPRRNQT